jgi:hypothetical protein
MALGGESRITAIATFVANGRTRQVRGNNLVPIEFEIQVQLPDKYSRRDEFPAQDAGPATSGFNGDNLIQIPAAACRSPQRRPRRPDNGSVLRARLTTAKQDLARLMLGLFAVRFGIPVTFAYVGRAERRKASRRTRRHRTEFRAVFIDGRTHLPLMLTWQSATPLGATRRSAAAGPEAGRTLGSTADRRTAHVSLRTIAASTASAPFRIRRGRRPPKETTFNRFRINADRLQTL